MWGPLGYLLEIFDLLGRPEILGLDAEEAVALPRFQLRRRQVNQSRLVLGRHLMIETSTEAERQVIGSEGLIDGRMDGRSRFIRAGGSVDRLL